VAVVAAWTSSGFSASVSSSTIAAIGTWSRSIGTQPDGSPAPVAPARPPRLAEAARQRVVVAQPQLVVVERQRDRIAPFVRVRPERQPLEQRPQRCGGEAIRLQEGHQEAQRQQHAGRHDDHSHGVERALVVDLEDLTGEVVGEVRREPEQRRHGDRHQRPPLGRDARCSRQRRPRARPGRS
jgi:hypothetical protein